MVVRAKKRSRDALAIKTLYPVTCTRDVEGVHIHAGGYDGWFDLGLVEAGVSVKLGGYDKDDDVP